MKTATVSVPGASLHYHLCGRGPLLLLLSGGGGDANALGALADSLESDYTVASYDRRGYARSPLDDPGDTSIIPIETAGDDAHRVLAALTSEPAYVFGSSLGALIGLELLTRHPEQVRLLIAHEPPTHTLIPESERPPLPDPNDPASVAKYAAAIGVKLAAPTNLPPEVERRRALNGKHFVRREARSARVYMPDIERLATVTSRLVLAGGEDGRPFVAYRCAAKAAERLGVPLVEFPGDHAAPLLAQPGFVEKLRALLARA
jgi:pimeloyl-ACP methyl ester carboxylesterase